MTDGIEMKTKKYQAEIKQQNNWALPIHLYPLLPEN